MFQDMVSAKALSDSLQAYLEEAEIYRVDHYLGKQGIQSIAEFRKVNQEVLEALQLPPSPSRAHNVSTFLSCIWSACCVVYVVHCVVL